ncbi:MAG: hypothetical protein M1838_004443 [Thelocarpon superellum]|nr:MAG: hypothetical protein M1838_004443 [Thelocarpon superellum]
MAVPHPSVTDLASQVSASVSSIERSLKEHGVPGPTFAADGPDSFPIVEQDPGLQENRLKLLEASTALYDLAMGRKDPIAFLPLLMEHTLAALRVISDYGIAELVPLSGTISFEKLADHAQLDVDRLHRVIRVLVPSRIFAEPEPGQVAHTAASKVILNPLAEAWLDHNLYEAAPASLKLLKAFKTYENSIEPAETAHKRFSEAMGFLASGFAYNSSVVNRGFDWASLGKAKVVDVGASKDPNFTQVGGSGGHISISLAQEFPLLTFVVQDMPQVEPNAAALIPSDLKDRISFMAHDFFQPQPVRDAAVFFFRAIFHDWSDPYCVKMIHALLPALRDGDRIIVTELVLPEPNEVPDHLSMLKREK